MALKPIIQHHRVIWFGAIAGILLAAYPIITRAQIVPDGTLETQAVPLTPGACAGVGGTCGITNGSTRGSNLFHSFRQFSLPNGDFAAFITDPSIQNVIVRVTGIGQPFISNINGAIATTNPTVTNIVPTNFFLLNPNGIVFGPNARILVGGSFLATTSDRMQFQNGTFRTDDPSPLLTVSVPIGLQFGRTPGSIQMQGSYIAAGNGNNFNDFALVGGSITLNNSFVYAPGQRVELSGVASGTVNFRLNGNAITLDIPSSTERADVSLINAAQIRVAAAGGGDIAINSRNFSILNGSILLAGITEAVGDRNRRSGDITIDATGEVVAHTGSAIANQVFPGTTGNSGNIQIQAKSIAFSDRAFLLATTFGQGNAGNIILNAQESITFDGQRSRRGFQSGIYSTVEETGIGKAGNIEINTGSLSITRGAQLDSSVFGKGNGGNIIVNARGAVIFDGKSADGFQSAAFSEILETGEGQGGTIQILADTLSVTNGAQLNTSTRNKGNAGNIKIDVQDKVLFSGQGIASTSVKEDATGNGGDIQISARLIVISSGGGLNTLTSGNGNAGNVIINARDAVVANGQNSNGVNTGINGNLTKTGKGQGGTISVSTGFLTLQNGATFQTGTDGQGNAGAIVINARDTVFITGRDAFGNSGLFTVVGENGRGQGGDIQITANSILLTDHGSLASATLGQGDAGNITMNANDTVLFDYGFALSSTQSFSGGNASNINISTGTLSITNNSALSTRNAGQGSAGDIVITADEVEMSARGQLITSTSGSRDAGNITLNIRDRLTLSGASTGLFANTAPGSSGNGGSIFIDPRTILIQDGATIAVNSQGSGTGGSIDIRAGRLELRDRGSITAETASAQGGDINLDVQNLLLLRRNSFISATAGTTQDFGNGGNIRIKAPFIIAVAKENSDITANAFKGNGGRITIDTNAIFGLQYRPQLTPLSDITASSQFGLSGTVAINTLNIDPNRGLVALPVNLSDASQQIVHHCTPGSKTAAGSFVVTGRGGIPLSPDEPLESRSSVPKWVPLPEEEGEEIQNSKFKIQNFSQPIPNPLVEAQDWIVNADGTVELVAQAPGSTVWHIWSSCESASNP